jgi:hypothetical protein
LTTVVSNFDQSALLVAVTVSVPAVDGAVYRPVDVIRPRAAFQVTFLFVVVPTTVALNGSVPDVSDDAVVGDTVTDVTPDDVATGLALAWDELAPSPLAFTAETT